MSITISVIIPVHNRINSVSELLSSLANQSYKHFEVIIVNDGSTEFSLSELEVLTTKYEYTIRIITQKNGGRSVARNKGVSCSNNELIIFVDSDMIAESSFIQKHLTFHLNQKNAIFIGSGYRNPNNIKNDFDKYIIHTENYWKNITIKSGEVNLKNYIFTACNMSILKQDFYKIGGFDEKLKDAEDFDFGIRALKINSKIFYDRDVIVWHNDWPNIIQFINRHREYSLAKSKLIKIHPDYVALFSNLIPPNKRRLKVVLLKICRSTICKLVVSDNIILKFFPLQINFFLYKITIAAYSPSK